MDPRLRGRLRGTLTLAFLATAVIVLLCSYRVPDYPLNREASSFNAERARQAAMEFITRNPYRLFGSLESRQSSGHLIEHLSALGYEVEFIHFESKIAGRTRVGRNLFALKEGRTPEILVVAAYYDTAPTTVQGAMNNGAAVGTLLELARMFANTPTNRSLLFVLSDGGEYGNVGAADMAESYPRKERVAAVLSLDSVAPGTWDAFRLDATGQQSGFAPSWLRRIASRAASGQGLQVQSSCEMLERALPIPRSDAGPLIRAGIPAINLGGVPRNRARARAIYHSSEDTMELIRLDHLQAFGAAAERILRSLDAIPAIPVKAPDGFHLFGRRFLKAPWVAVVLALCFVPLLPHWRRSLQSAHARLNREQIGRELWAVGATWLPFLVLFLGVRLAGALRLLPGYALYPATAKDPILTDPAWNVLGGLFGAAGLIALASGLICTYSLRDWPKPEYGASKTVLLSLLAVIVILAFAHNPFWAFLFLLAPAWIWSRIGCARSLKHRIIGSLGIAAGAIPCLLILWRHAHDLHLGWNYPWYHTLALHTGLFTPAGYFLGTMAATLGFRFIAIQGHGDANSSLLPARRP